MGNRVKGRPKKKSIKAASHSGMGSKRKLSRMGKKRKADHAGLDATFIGRSACLKRLQITLKDFRRLCILKGIYPREPRGRAPGNKKGQVFYHIKDVRAIAHEPVLHRFREFRAFMKKVRRAAGRNEKDEAARMEKYAPSYTLHHLVRERYPRFVDALSDLDDALSLVCLFAALPSEGRIQSKVTAKAKALAASWGAYCASTSSVTKAFVSVKGVYLEASMQNQATVRWVVPHAFTQHLPKDVDYRVMLTFFEFYETLLGFVLFKLYNDMGVRYPLPATALTGTSAMRADSLSSALAVNLHALGRELRASRGAASAAVGEAVAEAAAKAERNEETGEASAMKTTGEGGSKAKKSRARIKSVDAALHRIAGDDSSGDEDGGNDDEDEGLGEIGAPLEAALRSMAEEEEGAAAATSGGTAVLDDDAVKRRRLFAGLTFFLSREVPRGYLELVCLSFGGRVGWEGDDSPIAAKDPSITHHIVDRPRLPSSYGALPKSREFVQPQWLLDCANFRYLLPCARYGLGAELPPHLSPWVDDEEEGYKPAYAEEIKRLKNGEVLEDDDAAGGAGDSGDEHLSSDKKDKRAGAKEKEEAASESDDDESDEEEADAMKDEKMQMRRNTEEEEAKELAKGMMSKKAKRLYGRMQHGLAQKQVKVDELQRKRKEIELSKKKDKTKNLSDGGAAESRGASSKKRRKNREN